MGQTQRLADMLGGKLGEAVRQYADCITELRLRCGRPARLRLMNGDEISLEATDSNSFQRILNRLMENSLYAWEEDLHQGYFTTSGGVRVGVCGHMNAIKNQVTHLSSISSACIRIPREVRGSGEKLAKRIFAGGIASALIISPPGLGKTTLLRDLARIAAELGANVAIADERREIAASLEGVPQMDVGSRTDVMDSCPKALSIPLLLRACAPDLIVADEIGSKGDGEAIRDAARCGVKTIATAHGRNREDVLARKNTGLLLREDIFEWYITLGPALGQIREIYHHSKEEKMNA